MRAFPCPPVSANWPDPLEKLRLLHDEVSGLREFRAEYDRLMATEGMSNGEAIAALSGLVASVRQRPAPDDVDRRCAELREALEAARQECETIRLQALTAAANATMVDMEREEESDAMFLRLTTVETERDAARRDLSRVIAERDAQVRLTADLGARVAELEAATSAKVEPRQSPVAMLADARDAVAASGYGFVSIFSADERRFAAVVQVRDRRHAAALLRWRGGGGS